MSGSTVGWRLGVWVGGCGMAAINGNWTGVLHWSLGCLIANVLIAVADLIRGHA